MSKSSSHRRLVITGESTCGSPEDLLKSRKFAQFLCFFNQARQARFIDDRQNKAEIERSIPMLEGMLNIFETADPDNPEKKKVKAALEEQRQNLKELDAVKRPVFVTPEQVSLSSDLAEEVYRFYVNSDIRVVGGQSDMIRFEELLEETLIYIREGFAEILSDEELTDTPDWVLSAIPDCDNRLPARIVREMEYFYQEEWLIAKRSQTRDSNSKLISLMMNNFACNYVLNRHSKKKQIAIILCPDRSKNWRERIKYALSTTIGVNSGNEDNSELIRNQTYGNLFDEVYRAMRKTGLTIKEAREKNPEQIDIYLFPAFLELLKRGYKIYPDLSI